MFELEKVLDNGDYLQSLITGKRAGGERRGNSLDRKQRKFWMLRKWGDGKQCPCIHCGIKLSYHTIEADRIIPGGSYRHKNVQPSCRRCNRARSDNIDWQLVRYA